MKSPRRLIVAVRSGQIGVVYFVHRELVHWERTRTFARTPEAALSFVQKLVDDFEPDVLVSEAIGSATRKGARTKAVIEIIQRVRLSPSQRHQAIRRVQRHPNKHVESLILSKRHPALQKYLTEPRRIFDDEPRCYVLFEAVAMSEEAFVR